MKRGPVDQGDPMPKKRLMADRLLMKHVVAYVKRLGGTIRRRDGEYTLRLPNQHNPDARTHALRMTTYFTTDLLDALQTARRIMSDWHGNRPHVNQAELLLPLRWRLSTDAERFFLDHAGFSRRLDHAATTEPRLEDIDDARLRSARELAAAEEWAKANGYTFDQEPDRDADDSWMDGETAEYRKEWEGKAWYVQMWSPSNDDDGTQRDELVQSLGACYGDDDYYRVVKAELALEQQSVVERAATDAGYDRLAKGGN